MVGSGIGGKPGRVALVTIGDQARPPGPTITEVDIPLITVATVVVVVSVDSRLNVVSV
jgi:hypothetical protein